MRFTWALAALTLLGCGRGYSIHVEPDAGGATAPPCDLLLQDCVGVADACFPVAGGPPACRNAGSRGEGAPCAQANDCRGGLTCAGGAHSVCHTLCASSGATNTCGEGQHCGDDGLCTPAGSFAACVYSGGLDHLTLRHSDPARGLCTIVALQSPGTNTQGALSLPASWSLQSATVARIPGGCPSGFVGVLGAAPAELTGQIALFFPDAGALPDRLEADLKVFSGPDAGVPAQLGLQVGGLALEGCF